ncbi:hypothetical protein V9T40_008762 [Parthenolecanium corni]|uniref:Ubiquitin carboxyl-terminal hydrolase n=1 Tax=Parthenolecanium corni TaxID=536013 RepID=A0AAN9TR37_9HEMI
MIPESVSPVVSSSKSSMSSALNDCGRYYRTYSSSYTSPTYLTSHSSLIRSHSSKNANLFSDSSSRFKLNDVTSRLSSLKATNHDDYSSYSRPLITDKYSYKKKSLQISPTPTSSKYQSTYRSSSLPSSSYLSKTVDSKTLDSNANYKIDGADSAFLLPERRLNSFKSSLNSVSKKYDSNNYNSNDYSCKKDLREAEKKVETNSYRKKYEKCNGESSSDDSVTKWAGLRNVGNTCYMNSILQCLSSTKALKEYVMSKSYMKDINQDGKLMNAFSSLISKMWLQSSGPVDVSAFKDVFQRLASQFAGYDQHDAQEFLRFLVDKLHADVNRVQTRPKFLPEINDKLPDNSQASEHWKRYLMSENSYILDLFGGQLKSTLQCLVCGNKSVTFEIFWDLSLPLPSSCSSYSSSVSIGDILRNFTQEEILDNREKPRCSLCKVEQRMAKSYSFQKLPKYLVLHLKRFQTTSSYRKLSTVVQFPLTGLDMSPFLAKSVSSSRLYNLYAVSNHVGTPFTGHYTANCKHPHGVDWYTCNDATVSKISTPVMPKVVNADAYILFYEAVD